MYGFVTRAVFGLEITESKNKVRIAGIRTYDFIHDINKTFGTSRVTINMFNKATRTYVEFYSFFLIDIEYIVRRLIEVEGTRLGKRGYVKMHEALKENTWLRRLDATYPSMFNKAKIKEIKFELLKHQAEFIEYYDRVLPRYNLRGMLMAATPGSGKTISSIAVACAYESENVIVISPKNAVHRVWEKTLLEDMAVKQTVWVQASKKPMPDPSTNRWYIFHYESLGDAIDLAYKLAQRKCTVILDESHNLNEMKSLRTERFVNMCQMMSRSIVVELSGTPMKAMGAEAIPLIKAIDPMFTDSCAEKFKKIYGREAKSATEILANRLGIIMYKVNKEESKIDEAIEHTHLVKVKNAHRFTLAAIKHDMNDFIKQRVTYYLENKAKYNDMYYSALKEFEATTLPKLADKQKYQTYQIYVAQFVKFGYDPTSSAEKAMFCNDYEKKVIEPSLNPAVRKQFRAAKSVVKYVDLKIRGECLGTVLGRARTECNKAIVEHLDLAALIDGAEKKTLVFTSYVEVVKATAEKLERDGYTPLCVYADTNAKLAQMVKSFGEDESINPMIATYQSLSTAVPLTMANRVILLNAPFRIHEKEQTIARANRLGQDKTVEVFNVLLDTGEEPNISTRSSDIMEWSKEQVDAIMGFDNSDNMVNLESLCNHEEEIMEEDDFNYEAFEEDTPEEVTEIAEEVENEPSLENMVNSFYTTQDFIRTLNNHLKNGRTISDQALNMYRIINPPIDNIGMEMNETIIYRNMVSLEAERNRSRGFFRKIMDLFAKLIRGFMNFIKNSDKELTGNINRAHDVKRFIDKPKAQQFTQTAAIEISGAPWLTRGRQVTGDNHIEDLKWQLEKTTQLVDIVKEDLKFMSGFFADRLQDLKTEPQLNQLTGIVNRARSFNKVAFGGKEVRLQHATIIKSTASLGGKVVTISYPYGNDSAELLANHKNLKISTSIIDNMNVDNVEKVPPMNKEQALESTQLVTAINKKLTYINSFIVGTQGDLDKFTARANKFVDENKVQDDVTYDRITAQTSVMIAALRVMVTYFEGYTHMVNRATKASLSYSYMSAAGQA